MCFLTGHQQPGVVCAEAFAVSIPAEADRRGELGHGAGDVKSEGGPVEAHAGTKVLGGIVHDHLGGV
jgi:hypothetical protein